MAPAVSAALIILAAAYLAGMWRVARNHPARPWPAGRALTFSWGCPVIAVATQSSIGAYDDVLLPMRRVGWAADDADLDAYNAYLGALAERPASAAAPARHPDVHGLPPPGR